MRAQHDGSLLSSCYRNHLQVPLAVLCQRISSDASRIGLLRSQCICDVADNLAGEAISTIGVNEGEGDGIGSVSSHSPVAPIPVGHVNFSWELVKYSTTNQPSGPP